MAEEQINDANIQLMRQDIRSERKKIVAANMPLTETEDTKFWPVYDRYIAETLKVNDVRFTLLKEVISHKKTAMFFQIDHRAVMMIELQLAASIPLVKP